MKTTVERQYQVTDNPDGSKTLVFRSDFIGTHEKAQIAQKKSGRPGCLVPVVAIVSVFFLVLFINMISESPFAFVFLIIFVAAFSLLIFLVKPKKETIVKRNIMLTDKGLIYTDDYYERKQLAISDIDEVGVYTESAAGGGEYAQSSIVYAKVFGNRLNISGYFTQALAEAIQKEITNFYSGHFK